MKRARSAAVIVTIILLAAFTAGCLPLLPFACLPMQSCTFTYWLPDDTSEPQTAAPSPSPDATASPAPTREASASASPTAPPQSGDAASAIALAASHGIPEERLFGQYDLFLRYMETLDRNPSLGKYKEFVIRAFPALADNAEFLDEDFFFPRLESLVIRDIEPDDVYSGLYYPTENEILMAEEYPEEVYLTVYHELMHFFDDSIAQEPEKCRVLNGRVLTDEDYEALSGSEKIRTQSTPTVKFYSEFTIEAGAELFTAKYFTGSASSYTDIVSFLVGIEYIYGSDAVRRIFFSPDSSIFMAKLIQELGYDYTELFNINRSLSWYTDPNQYNKPPILYSMEDLLIDMYEKHMEGDWREDKRFRYILACVNGVEGEAYLDSAHAEELASSNFLTYRSYEAFEWRLLHELSYGTEIYVIPPTPMIEGGRFLLCAPGIWRDRETNKIKYGSLRFDYDFENKKVAGFDFIEGEDAPEEAGRR